MAIMRKTERGTLYANLWNYRDGSGSTGFGFGVYGMGPAVGSFECVDGKLKLFLSDDAMMRHEVEIVHVDDSWNVEE